MNLRTYLDILWRRKLVLLVTVVCAVAISAVGTQFIETRYRASTTLRLMTATSGSTEWVDYDLSYTDRLMNTYGQVARSASVNARLIDELELTEKPVIVVDLVANTELMKISVEYADATDAARIANHLADILIQDSGQSAAVAAQSLQNAISDAIDNAEVDLATARSNYARLRTEFGDETSEQVLLSAQMVELAEKNYEKLVEQYQYSQIRDALQMPMLTVLDRAADPLQPFQPQLPLNLALGFALGIAGGLVLIFLFENLSVHRSARYLADYPRLPSALIPSDSEANAALPMLPSIEESPSRTDIAYYNGNSEQQNGRNHSGYQPSQQRDSAFYQLYNTNWAQENANDQPHRIIIAGVTPFPERINLAFDFAADLVNNGKNVVLVDSDLWVPTLHSFLGLPNEIGLSSLLLQQCSISEATWLSQTFGVHVISAGPKPYHPEQLIGSSAMAVVLSVLAIQFDAVLIQAPTLNRMNDLAGLARYVDGILLSVADHDTWQQHERWVEQQLSQVNTPLLGVIIPQLSIREESLPENISRHNLSGHNISRHGTSRHSDLGKLDHSLATVSNIRQ